MFKKILVAVDGGAPAARAASTAYALAAELKAKVRLFHAVELPAATVQPAVSPEKSKALIDRESEEIFVRLIAMLPPDVSPQGLWTRGDPADEIVRAVSDWNADLLVIGSHGRDGVMRVVLGSVAEKVMRHATCPVLVIKAALEAPERARLAGTEPILTNLSDFRSSFEPDRPDGLLDEATAAD